MRILSAKKIFNISHSELQDVFDQLSELARAAKLPVTQYLIQERVIRSKKLL